MPPAKHPARTGRTAALRKTPSARLRSKPVTDLGVLNERLGYFVRRLQVWVFQDFIRRLAAIDISPAQFSVLVVISANIGLSQAELAATLGIERARLVRLLHQLESPRTDAAAALLRRWPPARFAAYRATAARCWRRPRRWSAEHEAALQEKLGAEHYRRLLETLREF